VTRSDVKVKKVEILSAGTRTMVIILMASNGVIRNKVCRVDFAVNPEIITFFHKFANGWLAGKSISEITTSYIGSVAVAMGEYSRVFTPVLGAIFELCREVGSGSFHVNGFTNLLAYPELREGAHELFSFLENREQVTRMLGMAHSGVNVIVGRENPHQELTKASVVVARYDIGRDTGSGIIALVGPVRLDYAKLIPHLEYFAQTMGKLLTETIEQDPEDESGLSADYR
jgi:heat-inducible transcriptional repressor